MTDPTALSIVARIAFLLFAGVAALVIIAATARRPLIGALLVVVGVPLTAGLARGSVVPVLRSSELLVMLVAVGVFARHLLRAGSVPYNLLDVAILAFVLGVVLIPLAVLQWTRVPIDRDSLRTIVGPLQYLIVYLIYSRIDLSLRDRRTVLSAAMTTSIVIAAIGLLQLANAPGVRSFITSYYSGKSATAAICEYGVCRPTSLLEHWSAFGAYALLYYSVALSLAATSGVQFSNRWLNTVMVFNAVAVFASQTQATAIGLALVTVIVLAIRRHVPRSLLVVGVCVVAGTILFWPQISARLAQQQDTKSGIATPQSLAVRERYWGELFLPVVSDHLWFGTGTIVPTDVPARLTNFVDNEYLAMAMRAGLVGLGLLLCALIAIGAAAVQSQRSPELLMRSLGTAVLAAVVAIAVMGLTAEYLTFSGVSQSLWMLVGLLSAAALSSAPQGMGRGATVAQPSPRHLAAGAAWLE